MKTIFVNKNDLQRQWFIIDATGKRLGHVAVEAARILRGKNRPYYTPHQEVGDYVIIINAAKAELTGGKEEKKIYYRHSGYPGGLTAEKYSDLLARKPFSPMEKAVKGMLPKGPLGRKLFTNLKVYAGEQHPHAAQKPEIVELLGKE